MLINNSQDIFWLSLSAAILILSTLLGLMMFYTIRIIRQASRMVDNLGALLTNLSEISGLLRNKLEDLGSAISFLRTGSKNFASMAGFGQKKSSKKGQPKQ